MTTTNNEPLGGDDFYLALIEHLGPGALTGGTMTPYRAFELGWNAKAATTSTREVPNDAWQMTFDERGDLILNRGGSQLRFVPATSTKPAGGVAGAGEVRTWQERMYTPNADGLLPESEIDAADAEIADLRAQLVRQQAPVGDSVVCKSLGALLLTQAEREKHDIGSPVGDSVLSKKVREVLQKAFAFGQTYWAQADSESVAQHKKSKETARKFQKFIDETCAHITAWKDAQLARAEQRGRTAAIEDYRSIVDDLRAQLARERQGKTPLNIVMLDGKTSLYDYLADTTPDEQCGDEWTKGFEEARRRLFKVVGSQLLAIHAAQAQGEPVALEPKCKVCKDTGIVYTGPVGDPPEQCDACFDQEPVPQAQGEPRAWLWTEPASEWNGHQARERVTIEKPKPTEARLGCEPLYTTPIPKAQREPVATVEAGKFANRLQWVSDEAMAQTPVGSKLYLRPAPQADEIRDGARLNWMAQHGAQLRSDPKDSRWYLVMPYHTGISCTDDHLRFDTPREAIDAALRTTAADNQTKGE